MEWSCVGYVSASRCHDVVNGHWYSTSNGSIQGFTCVFHTYFIQRRITHNKLCPRIFSKLHVCVDIRYKLAMCNVTCSGVPAPIPVSMRVLWHISWIMSGHHQSNHIRRTWVRVPNNQTGLWVPSEWIKEYISKTLVFGSPTHIKLNFVHQVIMSIITVLYSVVRWIDSSCSELSKNLFVLLCCANSLLCQNVNYFRETCF